MGDMLLRIGEFARLTDLPVKTVRYYGDIGLLPPDHIDSTTGYRRYRINQLDRARRLLALKALGLSLEDIGMILDDELSQDQFRSLLESRITEMTNESNALREQLERAKAQLNLLTSRLEKQMPEVTVKTTEQKTIAYVRETVDGVQHIAGIFVKLFDAVDPADGVGVAGNVYHHFAEDGSEIDIEAVIPVAADYQAPAGAAVRTIGPAQVASLMHHGAFNRLHEAHAALLEWVEDNGYEVSGPSYEWNLVCTPPVTQDNESYVTEVQVEVIKAG